MKIEVTITNDNGSTQTYVVSGNLPTRQEAYQEGAKRAKGRKHIAWKAGIFSAGAMWMLMKLTGISDIIK